MIPGNFAAILSGHIHRSQILTHDLSGRKMAAPVIYPGSIERTSFAERKEDKHYVLLEFEPDGSAKGKLSGIQFIQLPARPMVSIEVDPGKFVREELEGYLKTEFSNVDPDAIVRLKILGGMTKETAPVLRAPYLRELAPATMNVSLSINRNQERTASHEDTR
jgi:DNA repair exonuclease SbcCD nuclease subunit